MKVERLNSFDPFVRRLRLAYSKGHSDDVFALLDGAASLELRKGTPLGIRQLAGAFFTPTHLAERCLEGAKRFPSPVTDPACGAGDLLLAAARRLPVRKTAQETLRTWGESIHGTDIVPQFVAAAKLRIGLLAMQRTGDALDLREVQKLLPNILVKDAFAGLKPNSLRGLVVLNPPFGLTSEYRTHFNGLGRVSRAGIFIDAVIRALRPGAHLVAILPDVLRSGSSYARWRHTVSRQLTGVSVSVEGRFDSSTDVDVFILRGEKRASEADRSEHIDWYDVRRVSADSSLASSFEFRVGPIVKYRDPRNGRRRAFITVSDLLPGRVQHRLSNTWPAGDKVIRPPFLAVSRTSSPDDSQRVVASVIAGNRPVAVENHVITVRPRSGKLEDAIDLMDWLRSPSIAAHLKRRIRCRHLTVEALEELPLPMNPNS